MNKTIFLSAFVFGLCACGLGPQPPAPTSNILGLLKVTITGIGEGAVADAKAEWVRSGVDSQSATVVPVNGLNAPNDVQFIKRQVSFLDDDSAGLRYVLSHFELKNRTTSIFNNLTLYAVDVPGTTIGGTGIASMFDSTGAAITDAAKARAFRPTHGMHLLNRSTEVHSATADLQFFTPLEVNNTDLANLGIKQQAVNLGILTNTASVLEYGFVARNFSGVRTISARDDTVNQDCTLDTCKGQITLAYVLPKITPRQNNPFSFSLYFVVADEGNSYVAQSLEEQPAKTIAGIANTSLSPSSTSYFSQTRILSNSSTGISLNGLNNLCQVKIAISTASNPSTVLMPSTLPAATPGSLDSCFGAGGKRATNLTDLITDDRAYALALQTDGKIVLAGYSENGSNDFALVRYNPNGSLDTTFDGDGKVVTNFGGDDRARGVAIQSDGKIAVAGYSITSTGDMALARYNPNGSLDTTFDGDGKVTTTIVSSISYDQAFAVAIQSDGKIVAAGYSYTNSLTTADVALARYNSNGSLDTTFDTDGKVTTPIGSNTDGANALALQSDGKIVVAGYSWNGIDYDFALLRYNSNGSLDTTFDTDGKVTTAIGSSTDGANALAIQSDGKIVLAGYSWNGSNYDFALARYNSNGSLDTSFDGDGKVTTAFGTDRDEATAIAIQSDGKIVVAGLSVIGFDLSDFALTRYNPNGSLDTTFDGDGKVVTPIDLGADTAYALALQSDGKIVVAGLGNINGDSFDFALARYNP